MPIIKKWIEKRKEERKLKEDNGDGQVDRKKLNEKKEPKKLDITAEIIKLYHNDPISRSVIQYLLSKYKIIPVNAIESIKLHREELLLNIVLIYKKMWDARGSMMMKAMQISDKPMKIVIRERGKDESNQQKNTTKSSREDGGIERNNIERKSGEALDKKDSDKT